MTERWEAETIPASAMDMITTARIGHLATVNARGEPRVVPVCFAWLDASPSVIVSVLDEKPKRVGDDDLARVRNVRRNPACSLVVDHYEEDWTRLAFVQINGLARMVVPDEDLHGVALAALRAKYEQYRKMDLAGRLVVALEIESATAWRGDGGVFG